MLVSACMCLAKYRRALQPLAAASDSISSSPFIRSAAATSPFPTLASTHAFAGPVDRWCEDILLCWLVFVLSERVERERGRPGQLFCLGSA